MYINKREGVKVKLLAAAVVPDGWPDDVARIWYVRKGLPLPANLSKHVATVNDTLYYMKITDWSPALKWKPIKENFEYFYGKK